MKKTNFRCDIDTEQNLQNLRFDLLRRHPSINRGKKVPTEVLIAALVDGCCDLGLEEIESWLVPKIQESIRPSDPVAGRLAPRSDPNDFAIAKLAAD